MKNKDHCLLATASLTNGVYKFNTEKQSSAVAIISGEMWHCRLGHISVDNIESLETGVEGLKREEKLEKTVQITFSKKGFKGLELSGCGTRRRMWSHGKTFHW